MAAISGWWIPVECFKGRYGGPDDFLDSLGVIMSKVSYSDQERCAAVAMYRKTRSYVQTIIVMGYPSRYVLHTWVRESLPGRRPLKRQGHRQSFSSEKKILACERVIAGEPVRAVATDLGITNVSNVYVWLHQFTRGGEGQP